MTRETKIGLLVGLAFIILFAIILSEKGAGQRQTTVPQFTPMADAGRRLEPTASPLADAGKLPIETILPEPARYEHTKPARSFPAVAAAPPQSTKRNVVELPLVEPSLLSLVDQSPPLQTRTEKQPRPESTKNMDALKVAAVIPPSSRTEVSAKPTLGPAADPPSSDDPHRTLQSAIDHAAQTIAAKAKEEKPQRLAEASKQKPVDAAAAPAINDTGRTYTVRGGDTLTGLAKRLLGTSSPAAVETLYKANASKLKNRNSLVVGHVLSVPDIADLAKAHADGNELRSEQAESRQVDVPSASKADRSARIATRRGPAARYEPESPSAKPTAKDRAVLASDTKKAGKKNTAKAASARVYQIRPGDTLSRIAKTQLGDTNRVKALIDLNRNLLGRGDKLKPGMMIRLPGKRVTTPPKASAASAEGMLEVASR